MVVRTRDEFCCTGPLDHPHGRYHGPGPGLDASHYYGRGNFALRWSLNNVHSHCRACHAYLASNRYSGAFETWIIGCIGQEDFDELSELAVIGNKGQAKWKPSEMEDLYQCMMEYLEQHKDVWQTAGARLWWV